MGPLSALAVSVVFLLLALTWLGAATISLHVLGWITLIALIVILLDTFWFGSGARWTTYRQGARNG